MTNEEIERVIQEAASRLECAACVTPGSQNAFERDAVALFLPAACSLVSQALEEAARVTCRMCADGYPVEPRPGGYFVHPEIVACSASAIHSLKEQLQPAVTASQ